MPETIASRPYRPSNGTEGEIFQCEFCYRCAKDMPSRHCKIALRAFAFDIRDPQYPAEWIEDLEGPRCTAFVLRGSVPRKPRSSFTKDKRQIGLML